MLEINNWISINASIINDEPVPPEYPIGKINNEEWDKYFYELEQYNYHKMLNDDKKHSSILLSANFKF